MAYFSARSSSLSEARFGTGWGHPWSGPPLLPRLPCGVLRTWGLRCTLPCRLAALAVLPAAWWCLPDFMISRRFERSFPSPSEARVGARHGHSCDESPQLPCLPCGVLRLWGLPCTSPRRCVALAAPTAAWCAPLWRASPALRPWLGRTFLVLPRLRD